MTLISICLLFKIFINCLQGCIQNHGIFGVDIDVGWLEIASIGAFSAFVIYQTTHRPQEPSNMEEDSVSDDTRKCEPEKTNLLSVASKVALKAELLKKI